jgi:hypothetical protein
MISHILHVLESHIAYWFGCILVTRFKTTVLKELLIHQDMSESCVLYALFDKLLKLTSNPQ